MYYHIAFTDILVTRNAIFNFSYIKCTNLINFGCTMLLCIPNSCVVFTLHLSVYTISV